MHSLIQSFSPHKQNAPILIERAPKQNIKRSAYQCQELSTLNILEMCSEDTWNMLEKHPLNFTENVKCDTNRFCRNVAVEKCILCCTIGPSKAWVHLEHKAVNLQGAITWVNSLIIRVELLARRIGSHTSDHSDNYLHVPTSAKLMVLTKACTVQTS